MVTIAAIADTHGAHEEVKPHDGDILVVAGDFLGHGTLDELVAFNKWLGTQPHDHKIVIAGNHDWFCERNANVVKGLFTNAIYLDEEAVNVLGINFYGVPYTPEFFSWAFMYPRNGEQAHRIWDKVPENTNILVTHGPPAGTRISTTKEHLDRGGEDAGCLVLRARMLELPHLKATFHGHVHCGYGTDMVGQVTCMNATVMNEQYDVVHRGLMYEYPGR